MSTSNSKPGISSQRVRDAYANGNMFVHMFEFDVGERGAYSASNGASFKNLFDVMARKPRAHYCTIDHSVASRTSGFVGMPSTALKEGHDIGIWNILSQVGVVLDGNNTQAIKPIMVSNTDTSSSVRTDQITWRGTTNMLPKIAEQYGITPGESAHCNVPGGLREMHKASEKALPLLWKEVDRKGWKLVSDAGHCSWNEVTLAAKIEGVSGLIVCEIPSAMDGRFNPEESYKKAVANAVKLRDWLSETYPNVFKDPLPILSYNPRRKKDAMFELSAEQLADPQLPSAKSISDTKANRVTRKRPSDIAGQTSDEPVSETGHTSLTRKRRQPDDTGLHHGA